MGGLKGMCETVSNIAAQCTSSIAGLQVKQIVLGGSGASRAITRNRYYNETRLEWVKDDPVL